MVIISCKSTQEATQESIYHHTIGIGSGGGFTGQYIDYIIHENGEVWKDSVVHKQLSKQQVQDIFQHVLDNDLEHVDYNKPGNITYYLTLQETGKDKHTIIWGGTTSTPPKSVTETYRLIMRILNE